MQKAIHKLVIKSCPQDHSYTDAVGEQVSAEAALNAEITHHLGDEKNLSNQIRHDLTLLAAATGNWKSGLGTRTLEVETF